MNTKPKFAVIGGGSWAPAITKMLCVNLDEVAWYMRNTDAIEHLKKHHHNPMPMLIFTAGMLLLLSKQIWHDYQLEMGFWAIE